MSYTVFDLETTISVLNKRKASPWHPDNAIMAAGWKTKDGEIEGAYWPLLAKKPFDWFSRLLTGRFLVGHNIKFDILWAMQEPQNREAWMEFVAKGGLPWDTQLAEYLLEGMDQAWHMNSLDDCVLKYGGNLKIDEVKKMWAAGINTDAIPEELLMRYLLGGDDELGVFQHGDIGNTELVFKGQLERAKKQKQSRSILLNMGALCATIEMEFNGMSVDTELAETLRAARAAELDELSKELAALLPKDLPFEFNWGSRFHKSALIFGGSVKYDGREYVLDDEGNKTYFQKEEVQIQLGEDGEPLRFTSGKNKGEVKTKKVKVPDIERGPKMRNCKLDYEFPGYITPKAKWAGADDGVYSVSSDTLDEVFELYPDNLFIKTLAKHTAVAKDLGTYYWAEDKNGERKGMLTLVGEDGIIHHSLNHTSVVTARLSSSNPNMQNIPKGKKSAIKQVFRSRFPDGKIIQSDFSALEIYVQANLTRCRQLIADLQAGLDMHCKRLAEKTGKPYDEVLKLCKGWTDEDGTKHPADPEWDYMRTGAKGFSFQRAYGAGVKAIALSTGMSEEDVEELIAAESRMFPEIDEYFAERTKQIEAGAKHDNKWAYHPLTRSEQPIKTGHSTTPDGKRYSYSEEVAPDFLWKKGIFVSFSPTQIKNYEVQGTGGEWMKAALWMMVREFYRLRNFDGLALLVNTVHDAAYADAHQDVAVKAAHVIHACMLAASDFMDIYFGWEIAVPVPSDTTWGESMAIEEPIDLNDSVVQKLRGQLRERYLNGAVPSFLH